MNVLDGGLTDEFALNKPLGWQANQVCHASVMVASRPQQVLLCRGFCMHTCNWCTHLKLVPLPCWLLSLFPCSCIGHGLLICQVLLKLCSGQCIYSMTNMQAFYKRQQSVSLPNVLMLSLCGDIRPAWQQQAAFDEIQCACTYSLLLCTSTGGAYTSSRHETRSTQSKISLQQGHSKVTPSCHEWT